MRKHKALWKDGLGPKRTSNRFNGDIRKTILTLPVHVTLDYLATN